MLQFYLLGLLLDHLLSDELEVGLVAIGFYDQYLGVVLLEEDFFVFEKCSSELDCFTFKIEIGEMGGWITFYPKSCR